MSGSQGRFPPPTPPPHPQWRPEGEPVRTAQQPPPMVPRWPSQPSGQQPPFPPQYQPQPPTIPAQGGHPQAYGQMPPPAPPQDAGGQGYGWQPGMPPPGMPAQPPQPAGFGYPGQQPQTQRPSADPAAYDLGSYSFPAGQPTAPPAGLRTGRPTQPPRDPAAHQQWSPQTAEPYPYPPMAPGAAGQGPQGYGYQPQQNSALPANQRDQEAAYEEEVEYEETPPRRRRWLIAAALVGSVALGGGMAYIYKTAFASRNSDQAQVVKAPREPARVAPTERGGKQLPNTTNNTVMNRVPPEGTSAAAGGTTDSTGVRRVSTVPVDRNLAPMPPAPPTTSAGVPGMIVVGGSNPGMPPPLPPPSFEQQPRAAAPLPPTTQQPQQPRVAAAPPPPAVRPPPRQPAPEPTEAAARPAPPAQPAQTAVPRAKGGGYVAVLGYQRSQLEAMKMMADLQQKYDALRDKKLEIVQSDQTSRGLGVIYRVVVGPPGGITPAKEVCQQLYKAGMRQSGCYPLASN